MKKIYHNKHEEKVKNYEFFEIDSKAHPYARQSNWKYEYIETRLTTIITAIHKRKADLIIHAFALEYWQLNKYKKNI